MDARLVFEWTGYKAKDFVALLFKKDFLDVSYSTIVNQHATLYEVKIDLRLISTRKPRKKKAELKFPEDDSSNLQLEGGTHGKEATTIRG